MEIKKSHKADLERGRKARFFIGLAIALALFLGALEINISDGGLTDEELLEDIPEELALELTQQKEEEEPPQQVIIIEKEKPVIADKINIVDEEVNPETDQEQTSDNIDITSEPLDENADIEKELAADSDNPLVIRIVEELPEFPGGMTEYMKWLTKNLKYPSAAAKQKIQGKVLVSFIVNLDGAISNINIARPVHPLLDREAMRVISMMPRWKPGKDKGKVCRTMIMVPVVFAL